VSREGLGDLGKTVGHICKTRSRIDVHVNEGPDLKAIDWRENMLCVLCRDGTEV
jgi:hypothetical protein